MEQYLKNAKEQLRRAQEEILHPGSTYEQLENMQNILEDMIEDKVWEAL